MLLKNTALPIEVNITDLGVLPLQVCLNLLLSMIIAVYMIIV